MIHAQEALELIRNNKNVAIVGLSPKEERPSHKVGQFLIHHGFSVIPVHPVYDTILEQPAQKDLSKIPENWNGWVDLFLNPNRLMDLVEEIKRIRPKLVWCQIGVVNEDFNRTMDEHNIPLIVDHCPKIEWNNYP